MTTLLKRIQITSTKPLLYSFLVFCVCFYINTRNNHRPYWYAFDEESKAIQVIENSRNFNHPLLCVNSATLLHKIISPRAEAIQHVVVVGRIGSALFIALAAASLTWLSWRLVGPIASFLNCIFITLHPSFLYTARHFKEDASLLGTWSLLLAVLYVFQQKPTLIRAVWAGIAAALCTSSKYIGVIPALLSIWFVFSSTVVENGGKRSLKTVGVYLVAAVIGLTLINYQALTNFDVVLDKFGNEVHHQLNNDTGNPNPFIILAERSGWGGLLGITIYFIMRGRSYRAWPRIEIFALTTGGLYLLLLFVIERIVTRYVYPLWMIEWWLTAIGLGLVWRWGMSQEQRTKKVLLCVACMLLVAVSSYGLVNKGVTRLQAYGDSDSRLAMAKYIDQHLSPDDYVAYDILVSIPDSNINHIMPDGFAPRQKLYQMVRWHDSFGADMLRILKEHGMTHVITHPRYVDRYFTEGLDTSFGQFSDAKYRRPFYDSLRKSGEVVWEEPGGRDRSLSPMLRLYKLP